MSDLSRAIARARRQIEANEAPIRRQLAAAYRRAIDELDADLAAVTRMIRDARAAGVEVSPDWLRRQGRYRTLIVQAETQFARFSRDGLRILRAGQLRAVSGGAAEAWELMQAAQINVGFGANINTPAVERVVSALSGDSPLRGVLDRYGDNAARVIEERLVQGIIQGTGPREVTRQIRRELGSGLNRARLDTLVRTEMQRAFRGSLAESFKSMEHLGEGYRRVAAKSSRTCLACLALDGKISKKPPTRFHPRCRCIFHLVPIGGASAYESGEDWLRRQPEATQRAMFPSGESHARFQNGTLNLKDFVGYKRSSVWGPSVYERSGRGALIHATSGRAASRA